MARFGVSDGHSPTLYPGFFRACHETFKPIERADIFYPSPPRDEETRPNELVHLPVRRRVPENHRLFRANNEELGHRTNRSAAQSERLSPRIPNNPLHVNTQTKRAASEPANYETHRIVGRNQLPSAGSVLRIAPRERRRGRQPSIGPSHIKELSYRFPCARRRCGLELACRPT